VGNIGVHFSRPAVQLAALRQPKGNGQVVVVVWCAWSKVWPALTGSQQGPIYHMHGKTLDKSQLFLLTDKIKCNIKKQKSIYPLKSLE
jgi:hypothetical protein